MLVMFRPALFGDTATVGTTCGLVAMLFRRPALLIRRWRVDRVRRGRAHRFVRIALTTTSSMSRLAIANGAPHADMGGSRICR
jgi:hypothetical protein